MPRDFSMLRLDRIIFHEIPKRRKAEPISVVESEVDSPLNDQLRDFIQERIKSSLVNSSFEVVLNPERATPIPELVRHFLLDGGEGDFVIDSKAVAHHLAQSQDGVNNGGLVAIAGFDLNGWRAYGIIKLEKEEGVNLQESFDDQGRRTFTLTHLDQIMFTKKTKVFKVAFFVQPEVGTAIEGYVADLQRGKQPQKLVADFYLAGFLGADLRGNPAIDTKDFFDAAEGFFAHQVSNPKAATGGMFALIAEMNSDTSLLNPRSFVRTHVPPELRDDFLDHLREKGIDPDGVIVKEVDLVSQKLDGVRWIFAGGISMSGSDEAFQHHVTTEDLGNGRIRVVVVDGLRDVKPS